MNCSAVNISSTLFSLTTQKLKYLQLQALGHNAMDTTAQFAECPYYRPLLIQQGHISKHKNNGDTVHNTVLHGAVSTQ